MFLCAADQSFCTSLEVPLPQPLPYFLPIYSLPVMSLTYCPCVCFLSSCFPFLAFHSSDTPLDLFASSTFTDPFSPTFLSNTSWEFLTYQLKLFPSPRTQASQLMSPAPPFFLDTYILAVSLLRCSSLLGTLKYFKIQRRGRQR